MSMVRCVCGKLMRSVEVCSLAGCKRLYLCIGCNKEAKECTCKNIG